jgi:hypothetical protein
MIQKTFVQKWCCKKPCTTSGAFWPLFEICLVEVALGIQGGWFQFLLIENLSGNRNA